MSASILTFAGAVQEKLNYARFRLPYGEDGEGICLELTLTREVMKAHQLLAGPVTYSDATRVLNRAEDWRTTFLELADVVALVKQLS